MFVFSLSSNLLSFSDFISVTPSELDHRGNVKLKWELNNADEISLVGIKDNLPSKGELYFEINQTTQFIIKFKRLGVEQTLQTEAVVLKGEKNREVKEIDKFNSNLIVSIDSNKLKEIESYKFKQVEELSILDKVILPEKNPGVAFALSFFVPGAGQMYNEDLGMGFALFGISALGAGLTISSPEKSKTVPLFILALPWIYSIIEAPLKAMDLTNETRIKKYEKQNNNSSSSLNENNQIDYTIYPVLNQNSTGFGIQVNF